MRYLLAPFALIYLILTEIRLLFYKQKIFKQKALPVPVISIGNLSFGGTGKTPFTIELAKALHLNYPHILILSRGYKRNSKGALIVSLKGDIKVSVNDSGDEAMLISQKCDFASVVVAEDRSLGYELIRSEKPDLVILDDAFQHLKIKRDVDILLTSGYHPFWSDTIFPIGRLREKKSNYKRADFICITKTKNQVVIEKPNYFIPYKGYSFSSEINFNEKYTLMTGIVDNSAIVEFLEKQRIQIESIITLKDHADASNYEKYSNLKNLIVTEKDSVKLNENFLQKVTILRVEMELSEALITAINDKIVI